MLSALVHSHSIHNYSLARRPLEITLSIRFFPYYCCCCSLLLFYIGRLLLALAPRSKLCSSSLLSLLLLCLTQLGMMSQQLLYSLDRRRLRQGDAVLSYILRLQYGQRVGSVVYLQLHIFQFSTLLLHILLSYTHYNCMHIQLYTLQS